VRLTVDFEINEKMTNIGFAKAVIDTDCFKVSDLQEIGNYLMIYANARANESLERACVEYKGGAECRKRNTDDCRTSFYIEDGELYCATRNNDFCSYGERKDT